MGVVWLGKQTLELEIVHNLIRNQRMLLFVFLCVWNESHVDREHSEALSVTVSDHIIRTTVEKK